MAKFNFYLIFICLLSLGACNFINPKEQVPTYIQLDAFEYSNPDSNFTGSSTHNIPSAWIYADDQSVGTFDLPCIVPVMMNKTSKIKIVPAVYNQGMKGYVIQYPFYEFDSTTLVFNPGKVQHYSPKTRYLRSLKLSNFKLNINFEEGLLFRNVGSDGNMELTKDPSKVITGNASGLISLDQNKKFSALISTSYFEYNENNCYLEFDYKCSIPFQIGLQAEDNEGKTTSAYLMGVNPTENPNKIYLNLSTFILSNKRFNKFYIIMRSDVRDFEGKYKEGFVVIDNLKIITP